MGKGMGLKEMGSGNGLRPVGNARGLPGRGGKLAAASRRERFRFCSCCGSLCLSEKLAEERVVEPVATTTDAQKQSLFGQAAEVFSFVLIVHLPWTDLVSSRSCYVSQELNFSFGHWREVRTKLLVL